MELQVQQHLPLVVMVEIQLSAHWLLQMAVVQVVLTAQTAATAGAAVEAEQTKTSAELFTQVQAEALVKHQRKAVLLLIAIKYKAEMEAKAVLAEPLLPQVQEARVLALE